MHDTLLPSQALEADFPVPTDNSDFSVGTENSQPCPGRGRPRGSHTDRTLTLKVRCTPAEHRILLGLLAQVHLNEYPQERPAATVLVQALQEHANVRQAGRDHR
jgi:hypothetical protein